MRFVLTLTNGVTVAFERDAKTGAVYVAAYSSTGTMIGDSMERNEDFKRMAAILTD